jgi:hypothetical protein
MMRIVAGFLVLLPFLPALGDEVKAKNQSKTPAEQLQALIEKYEDAYRAYAKARKEAKTFEERDRVRKELYPDAEQYAPQFFALAEQHAKDPAAVDALVWIMRNVPTATKESLRTKAVDLLLRDHIQSEKLGDVCRTLNKGVDAQGEMILRAALEKNPHAAVQGDICLALAQRLGSLAEIVHELNQGAEAAAQHAESLGKERVAELQKRDADQLSAESQQLFRRFAEQYLPQLKEERQTALCFSLGLLASDKGSERLLRTLCDQNSKRNVRGVAYLSLGQLLKNRLNALPDADSKDALALQQESLKALDRAATEYADVTVFRAPLGERAKAELYELQQLSRGRTAPEIEAEDIDGRTFKLSDYRGKVVLLDFWGHW